MAQSRGEHLANLRDELAELRKRAPWDLSLPLEDRITFAKQSGEHMLAASLSRDLRERDRPLTEEELEELDRQRRQEVWDYCIEFWAAEDAAALAESEESAGGTAASPPKEIPQ